MKLKLTKVGFLQSALFLLWGVLFSHQMSHATMSGSQSAVCISSKTPVSNLTRQTASESKWHLSAEEALFSLTAVIVSNKLEIFGGSTAIMVVVFGSRRKAIACLHVCLVVVLYWLFTYSKIETKNGCHKKSQLKNQYQLAFLKGALLAFTPFTTPTESLVVSHLIKMDFLHFTSNNCWYHIYHRTKMKDK